MNWEEEDPLTEWGRRKGIIDEPCKGSGKVRERWQAMADYCHKRCIRNGLEALWKMAG